jgi:hypothetical protein
MSDPPTRKLEAWKWAGQLATILGLVLPTSVYLSFAANTAVKHQWGQYSFVLPMIVIALTAIGALAAIDEDFTVAARPKDVLFIGGLALIIGVLAPFMAVPIILFFWLKKSERGQHVIQHLIKRTETMYLGPPSIQPEKETQIPI